LGITNWFIGCSGFHYDEWKTIFYPEKLPKSKWFEFYCEHFNTLELNVTFYRFPTVETLRIWYDNSPKSFRFSLKAPMLITHFKKFTDSTRLLSDFYNALEKGLKDKLGCVLFQLPKQIVRSDEKLEQIIKCIKPGFDNVIEFRDASWWHQKVYDKLKTKSITFCGISHPPLPDEVIKKSSVIYYRFHGRPSLYKTRYKISELSEFKNSITKFKGNQKAFIYFNNTAEGAAVLNAKELKELSDK